MARIPCLLTRYLGNVALGVLVGLDHVGNAVTGGDPTVTISYRSAVACREGSRFGCRFCRFLAWLIEPDHCAKQLAWGPVQNVAIAKASAKLNGRA